jgi:hypothetical protein
MSVVCAVCTQSDCLSAKNDQNYRRIKEIPVLHVIGAEPRVWKISLTAYPGHEYAGFKIIAADMENLNPAYNVPDPNILEDNGWDILDIKKGLGYNGADIWKGKAVRSSGEARYIEVLNRERGLCSFLLRVILSFIISGYNRKTTIGRCLHRYGLFFEEKTRLAIKQKTSTGTFFI